MVLAGSQLTSVLKLNLGHSEHALVLVTGGTMILVKYFCSLQALHYLDNDKTNSLETTYCCWGNKTNNI